MAPWLSASASASALTRAARASADEAYASSPSRSRRSASTASGDSTKSATRALPNLCAPILNPARFRVNDATASLETRAGNARAFQGARQGRSGSYAATEVVSENVSRMRRSAPSATTARGNARDGDGAARVVSRRQTLRGVFRGLRAHTPPRLPFERAQPRGVRRVESVQTREDHQAEPVPPGPIFQFSTADAISFVRVPR